MRAPPPPPRRVGLRTSLGEALGGEDASLPLRLLLDVLRPLSVPYRLAQAARLAAYRRGWLRAARLPIPTLSVGNLSVGGTGKTTTALFIARILLEAGLKPALVSRGYGGEGRGPLVVSDGKGHRLPSPPASDEAALMARELPGVPVVTGSARVRAAEKAVEELGAQAVVLDDGFQHLALSRDLDLVLLSAPRPLGNGRLLPAGPLREPPGALERAHALLLTGLDGGELDRGEEELRDRAVRAAAPGKPTFGGPTFGGPIFRARYVPEALAALGGEGESQPVSALRGLRALSFSGLARPGSFEGLLERAGVELLGSWAFPDHHRYQPRDLRALDEEARRRKAELLLTTAKDAAKLERLGPLGFPVWVVRVKLAFEREEEFRALVLRAASATGLRS
ncbi:MAG: tetraacyldisaccharide 4'-kinase [Nitrospinota bacterium]